MHLTNSSSGSVNQMSLQRIPIAANVARSSGGPVSNFSQSALISSLAFTSIPLSQNYVSEIIILWHRVSMIATLIPVFQLAFIGLIVGHRPNVLWPSFPFLNAYHPFQKSGAQQLFCFRLRKFACNIT